MILFLGQCTTHAPQAQYIFEWDINAENHTGKVKNHYAKDGKHRGMSVFGWHRDVDEDEVVNQLIKNNIEGIAIVPFYYQETERTKVLRPRQKEIGEYSRIDSMYIKVIGNLKEKGMHIFLKPHIWMRDGWRSNIQLDNSEEWDAWFQSYRSHILNHALLAESLKVDLFCIGTELRTSIKNQPDEWLELINEIKKVYTGKLTYAMNWDDDFDDIKFWSQMDYIGVQGYYPLTKKRNPSLIEIKEGWQKHIKELKLTSRKYQKPILFTEVGYRSDEISTIEPWVWDSAVNDTTNTISNQVQNLAYEALFQELWNEDWFSGMYFWQWHIDHMQDQTHSKMDFTPRYKDAENTIAKWYGKQVLN